MEAIKIMNARMQYRVNAVLRHELVRFIAITVVAFVGAVMLCTAASMAQAAASSGPDYGIWCRVLGVIAPWDNRVGIAMVAGGAAVFDMHRHNQNPLQWAKEHPGTMTFIAVLIALPSVLTTVFGSKCGF